MSSHVWLRVNLETKEYRNQCIVYFKSSEYIIFTSIYIIIFLRAVSDQRFGQSNHFEIIRKMVLCIIPSDKQGQQCGQKEQL